MEVFYIGPDASFGSLQRAISHVVSKDNANLIDIVGTISKDRTIITCAVETFARFVLQLRFIGPPIIAWMFKLDLIRIIFVGANGRAFRTGYDYSLIVATDELPNNLRATKWDVDYKTYLKDEFGVEWNDRTPFFREE